MKNVSEEPFLEWLKLGKIRIENGQIIIFNATNLIFPTRSFLFLRKKLLEEFGKEKCDEILREVGRFQIRQALVRYSKIFEIEKVEKQKIQEMWTKIFRLLGLGKLEFTEKEAKIRNNPIATEYRMMYGTNKEPIDSYICGMADEAYKAFLGKEVEIKETKCIACGDPYCQFEVFQAKKEKS